MFFLITSKVITNKRAMNSETVENRLSSSNASNFTNLENRLGNISFQLLAGEQPQDINDASYICPYFGAQPGTLFITNYRFQFQPNRLNHEKSPFQVVDVPLGTVARIEKVGGSKSKGENAYGIDITCKDLRNVQFAFKQETHFRRAIVDKLQRFSFPFSNNSQIFAYDYKETFVENGWNVYDPVAELRRMKLGIDENIKWRITEANTNYELCDTYPKVLAVPRSVSDDDLRPVAKFRSRGRLPVLSWIHPTSHATITRCAQPLTGMKNKKSPEDESYIAAIKEANPKSDKLSIIDARPLANAIANKARGGGYESEDAYPDYEIVFVNIHSIHVMRESSKKLKEVCFPGTDDQKWLSSIDNTNWLKHIKCILSGAMGIVDRIENMKNSVLVHCSDGWDRTAQLTSVAILLLDPYYRTIRGFEILIEKEWLSFGHKFQQRIGHGDANHSDTERSPVFVQFIECVWQISRQFPRVMEFNEHFLITILDHLYSCRFGTFLKNNERERVQDDLKQNTVSLWSWINSSIGQYRNPLYEGETIQRVLKPVASMRHIRLWKGLYCRWDPTMKTKDPLMQRTRELLVLEEQLRKRVEETFNLLESTNGVMTQL